VNKHLEHIYEKLGVETRAAAAALAMRAVTD
jgi:DNA-binding CsgD family transcriptional regulator